MLFKAKAPGSLMLMGEYAVLHGKTAIISTINKFISVTIKPRDDGAVHIRSQLGQYQGDINQLTACEPFTYVLCALQQSGLNRGCNIDIDAEFASDMGLGSSAAVSVATLMALNVWQEQKPKPRNVLWQQAKKVITQVQGQASGADIAASIYGGVITFRNKPLQIKPLHERPPISVVYSGNKLATPEAIKRIKKKRKSAPMQYHAIDHHMEKLTLQTAKAIQNKDWLTVGILLNAGQRLMDEMGVNNETLNHIIQQLRKQADIYGAKISGAGFGDCVIGIGHSDLIFPLTEQDKRQGIQTLGIKLGHAGASLLKSAAYA